MFKFTERIMPWW